MKDELIPTPESFDSAEILLRIESELLRICHYAAGADQLIAELLQYFKTFTGCEAVGVRLLKNGDFPYFQTTGFPANFVAAENSLCAVDALGKRILDADGSPLLECMCGNVLCGRINPSKPFFTSYGSFWTNSTSQLLATTSETDRQARTRNRCNGEGYESVALIPMKVRGKTYGLFQFNDPRPNCFNPERIAALEHMVDYVALAFANLDAVEALREQESQFRTLVENSQDYILRYDREHHHTYANTAALRITGLSAAEFFGHSHRELGFPEHLCVLFENAIDRAFATGQPQREIFSWASQEGEITLDWRLFPEFDAQGEIQSVLGVSRDISDIKHAEQALAHSRDLMRYIIEHNRSAVAVHDCDLNYIYVSQRYLDDYNIQDPNIIGKHHYEVFPDLPQKWRDVHQRALRGEVLSGDDDPYTRENGAVEWTRWECRPWYQAHGEIGGIIVYTEVITTRKQVEQALRESEEMFRYIFDHSAIGKSITSPNGKINVNQAFADMLGYTREEMQNKHWQDITIAEDIEPTEKLTTALLNGEVESLRFNKRYLHKNGSVVWADVRSTLRRSPDGKPLYFMTSIIDITARLQAEAQIQAQLEELRRWHAVTLGREDRILELKREVNELLIAAGRPPHYGSALEKPDHE